MSELYNELLYKAIDEYCSHCPYKRPEHCTYPCGNLSEEILKIKYELTHGIGKQSKQEIIEENESQKPHKNTVLSVSNLNDVKDFLNYDVCDSEWLDVLNGKKTIEVMLDVDELFMYMDALNKDYCEEHNLCEKCRSELIQVREEYEVFGKQLPYKYWECPKCLE